jgi:serine phosphatase RsbU (regulator of sigma subunit)
MWFEKKKVIEEPTPEEIEAQKRVQLAKKLEEALKKDPLFQALTVDNLNWICPYTLTRVPAPFGYVEPARDYLLQTQPWTKGKPKAIEDVHLFRWQIYLTEHLEMEGRLRIFGPGDRWLNPFNLQWVRLAHPGTTLNDDMLQDIAIVLSCCTEARSGQLPEQYKLDEVIRNTRFDTNILQEIGPTSATQRVSGSRADKHETTSEEVKTSLDSDMGRAQSILEKMLSPLPAIPGYGFMVHYEPHSQVGGDFYECTQVGPGQYFIALADVTGHGVQGAMVVVAALKALRYILKQERGLVEVVLRLNEEIKHDLLSGQFITMFAAILDVENSTLTCVCAGHHPSFLASTKRRTVLERIGNQGGALGLMANDVLKRTLKPQVVRLEPGDSILIYTDGLTESRNAKGVEYGDCRLMGNYITNLELPYDEVVSRLVLAARHYAAGVLEDDVTLMLLSFEAPKEEAPTVP